MISAVTRMGDVPMKCKQCGHECRLYDCEPDCDGDGALGCPVEDCGGIMKAQDHTNLLGFVEAE